ncbi:tyrosine-type recombinase/integrase [Croceimicrobium sp.]|uniref:tyrosine-type recombinase/integrase n=1 Tax=Croceimicrobium sp. TaxID=2828340 RepID=UPI003BAAF012
MHFNNESITLHESINIYLNWKKTHTTKAPEAYRVRLEQFADYFKAEKSHLKDITGDDITTFHNQLLEVLSPATVAYSARILRNYFTFWQGRGQVNLNPKEIIPIRFINADKDIVEKEDFEDMVALLDDHYIDELQKKLVLHLLWDTGMRISELLELKLSDIQPKGSNGLRAAKVKTRKTMRYNLVVWGASTDELLLKYLAWRLEVNHPGDWLFVPTHKKSNHEEGICTRTVQRWVKQLAKQAMLDKQITPHSFRHGKAHYMLDHGASAVDVQAVLRHRNLNSSLNYMQLNEKQYLRTTSKFLDQRLAEVVGIGSSLARTNESRYTLA